MYLSHSRHSDTIIRGIQGLLDKDKTLGEISEALEYDLHTLFQRGKVLQSEVMDLGGIAQVQRIFASLGLQNQGGAHQQFQQTFLPKIPEYSTLCTLESYSDQAFLITVPNRKDPVWILRKYVGSKTLLKDA